MLAVVAGIVLLGGYLVFTGIRRDDEPKAACVMVVDRTGSSADATTIANYKEDATRTIQGCAKRHASLEIYSFDEEASKLNLESPKALYVGKKSGVSAAEDVVEDLLNRQTSGAFGSNILAAMIEAAKHVQDLSASVGRGERFLVMLTDGYQYSEDISIDELTEDVGSAQPLVERAADLNLDLTDMQVSMVGVLSGTAAPSGGPVGYPFERSLEAFWTGVIEGAHGQLCTYGYETPRLPGSCGATA